MILTADIAREATKSYHNNKCLINLSFNFKNLDYHLFVSAALGYGNRIAPCTRQDAKQFRTNGFKVKNIGKGEYKISWI